MLSNFIAFWLIAIPLGLLLAFKFNMYLFGFWIALAVASIVLCSIMLFALLKNINYKNTQK